jgi:hypothetical protein
MALEEVPRRGVDGVDRSWSVSEFGRSFVKMDGGLGVIVRYVPK